MSGAATANDPVVLLVSREVVVSTLPEQVVWTHVTEDLSVIPNPGRDVVTLVAAVNDVDLAIAEDAIRLGAPVDGVKPRIAGQDILVRVAADRVISSVPIDYVVAAHSRHDVIASRAIEVVGPRIAEERRITSRP